MKKPIIYLFSALLAIGATSCNSDDPNDACEKHVYTGDEAPYLRSNAKATNSLTHNFLAARIDEPLVINLKDYAASFHKNLDMTVDEALTALDNGNVVFYSINSGRQIWNLTAPTLGNSGWYFNTAGQPTGGENGVFSVNLDRASKKIEVRTVNEPPVGTLATVDFGFAINNGHDFDNYVRFMIDLSVTDPSTVILNATVPGGDYAGYEINLGQFAEAFELCMGIPYKDVVNLLDNEAIDVYLVGADGNWVVNDDGSRPDYTSGWLGYWLNPDLQICYWDGGGYPNNLMFLEYAGGGTYVLGNAGNGGTPAGTQALVKFDFVLNGDPASAVHFIVNVTFG